MKSVKLSSRARYLERFQKNNKGAGLNLVSLMDIFTILVFFLLVSSSNVQQLPSTKDVKLPTSTATKAPKETLTITLTKQELLVQGKHIARLDEIQSLTEEFIPSLKSELEFQSTKSILSEQDSKIGRAITIMGDENIPYSLLRKILATCRLANYTKVAFAAMQKAKGKA